LSDEQSFNVTNLSIGNHTISFRVQDGHGYWSDMATSYLEIKAHPQSSISSVSSSSFDYGTPLYLEGTAGDKDGNVSAFEWKSDIDGIISKSLSTGPIILSPGDHNIRFKVKDDDGLWSISNAVIVHVNDIPYVSIESITPNPAYKYDETEQFITFVGIASDNDGFITEHLWTSSVYGVIGSDNVTSISANNLSVGNHTIAYKSKDNFGTWSEQVFTQLEIRSHPRSEIFNVTPGFQAEDQPVQFDGGGADEDGIIVGYEWYSSLDGFIGVLSTFNITDLSSGNHTISFRVQDDDGLWSDYDTSYVLINSRPRVELINSIPDLVYAYGPDHDLPGADIYTLGYWHFDAIDDNKVSDHSFNNHDASVQGNPTQTGGLFDSSLEFDGTVDSLSTPQLVETGTKTFDEVTIEAWVYLDQNYVFDRNRVIFASGWDGRLEVGVGLNHKAYLTVYSDTLGVFQISSENELNKLQWYHVAAIYSEQNDQMVLYINGEYDSSLTIPEQFELGRSALVENCIGAIAGCSAGNFIGLIDELRITSAILYPEQFLYRPDRAYISAIVVDYDSQVTGGVWESDLDGILGTDPWLSKYAMDLSPGLHNLTFRAVDEYDVWSVNSTTQIYVSTYPVVTNLSIESTYEYPVDQEMVWFNGSVSDYDGGSLVNFQWFSSIDGTLGEDLNISMRLSNGTHEIRFRAQDNEGHWSAWKYGYYYVDVHPISNIQVESGEAYRGLVTPIYISVGENSTQSSELSVEIEINVTDSEWSKDFMVQPEFDGSQWVGFFEPSLSMQPGLYEIRGRTTQDASARSTHNDSRTTPWIHLLDVEVLNNAPVIGDITFSNTTLERSQEAVLTLDITDSEASGDLSVLDVRVFYFDKDNDEWASGFFSDDNFNEASGLFEIDLIPPSDLKVGKYDLKIEVTDSDGEVVTLIQDKIFTIINSPPIVQQLTSPPLEYYEQDNSSFWLNVSGDDFDGEIFRYEWRSDRQGTLPCTESECELDPQDLLPGVHEIRVYAEDEDGQLSEPFIFEIEVYEVAG
ncbi:MAG: LamG domain-containing protein, partial [Candidatus Thermoplasmatota archaeon]|nr:LamG domain-containing protein [Candidatus Thermoplasmatota archaeon]